VIGRQGSSFPREFVETALARLIGDETE